jgi:hypothetical protein
VKTDGEYLTVRDPSRPGGRTCVGLIWLPLAFAGLGALFGCPNEPPPPPPPPDHQTIGPAGGTLRSRDSSVTLVFPPGAVSQATEMSLVLDSTPIITDTALGHQLGPAIKLSPEGMVFDSPVTITVKLPQGLQNPRSATISPLEPSLGLLLWQPSQLDSANGTVTTTTSHFSTWVPWAPLFFFLPNITAPSNTYSVQGCPSHLRGAGSTCSQVAEDVNRAIGTWEPLLGKSDISISPGPFISSPSHIAVRLFSSLVLDGLSPGWLGYSAWNLRTHNREIFVNDKLDWYPTEASAIADRAAPGHFNIERTVAHELGHHIGLGHIGSGTLAHPAPYGTDPVMGYGHLGLPLPLSCDDLYYLEKILPQSTGPCASAFVIDPLWQSGRTVAPNSPISPGPSVLVTDGATHGVEGVTVVFDVTEGGGTTQGRVAATNSAGIATIPGWTAGPAGPQRLRAYGAALTPETVDFVVTVSGDGLTPSPQLALGGTHTCGLTGAGMAYCWGENSLGQVGDGTYANQPQPTAVQGGRTFAELTAGEQHTCGLATNGKAYCWGNDGALPYHNTPETVQGGLSFTQLTAGGGFTCGLATDGKAYCWGGNGRGQLGAGPMPSQSAPVRVQGGYTFTELSAGANYACGLTSSGAAYCWGGNTYGQLGDGTSADRYSPALVQGGQTFIRLTTGWNHACGLARSGAALCWGGNRDGQLGDGMFIDQYSPVQVRGAPAFTLLSAGTYFTCGLTALGAAYCWGGNGNGQLGDSTFFTTRRPPAPVVGGHSFTQVAVGGGHTCGLTGSGAAYCWGLNNRGQLGAVAPSYQGFPVQVQGGVLYAAGVGHSPTQDGKSLLLAHR